MKKKLTLKIWIDKNTSPIIAKKLGIHSSTVRHWRRGHCLPKAEQMFQIKRLTKGRLTYSSMIDGHFESSRK